MSSVSSYISQNPYRTLGVVANAGIKPIQKNLSKLKAFSKIGKSYSLEYDLSFLNLSDIDRSEKVLTRIENKILLDENKVKYTLFWFIENNPIDSVALNNLTKGNIEKAKEIWEKTTINKEITTKNLSAVNNLATLLLFKNLDDTKTDKLKKTDESIKELRAAIALKNSLITSLHFKDFCDVVCKGGNGLNSTDAQAFFSEEILEILSINFSNKELLKVFEGLDDNLSETLNNSLVEQPINKIKSAIKNANDKVVEDNSAGITIGKELIKNTLNDLKQIKEVLGKDDYQYQTLADRLANQIMQCGIFCFNKTHDDYKYLSSYKYALSISIESDTIQRANDCIKHCEEEKVANLCSSCNKNKVNPNNKIQTTIYKETNRTYNRVNYQRLAINIFLCNSCYHEISENSKQITYVGIGVGVLALFITLIGYNWGGWCIAGGIIGYVIGAFIGGLIYGGQEQKAIDNNKTMKEYLKKGWQTYEPQA